MDSNGFLLFGPFGHFFFRFWFGALLFGKMHSATGKGMHRKTAKKQSKRPFF